MESLIMLAAGDDSLDPHVLPEPGTRAKALCGYSPYSHWKGFWVRPMTDLQMAAVCSRCRAAVTGRREPVVENAEPLSQGLFRRLFRR